MIGFEYFFTSIGQSIVFVYPVEVFPTTTRMLAIGFLGLFMYFLIPSLIWISSYLEQYSFNPVISCFPYAIMTFFLSFYLPETLNKKLE